MAKRGRPKKNPELAQLTNTVVEDLKSQAVVLQSTPDREPVKSKVELNDIAYSVTRDPKTQHWLVLEIPYDVKTGTVGEIKRVEMNSERIIILERLEILVQNTFHR